jgi:hypothetical protein
MSTPSIRRIACARHRNGICGSPFQVVLFHDGASRKLGILFDAPTYCAVLDIEKLAQGDIAFGSNSWRGDHYKAALRRLLAASEAEGGAP